MGLAILAIILGLVFLFLKLSVYKGAAIPLLVMGLLMGITGFVVFQRSDRQRIDMVYAFDMNPDRIKNEELPRMQAVLREFLLLRYIELVLLVIGIAMLFYFRPYPAKDFWKGLGLSLAIMAVVALLADFYAERRNLKYVKGLQEKIQLAN